MKLADGWAIHYGHGLRCFSFDRGRAPLLASSLHGILHPMIYASRSSDDFVDQRTGDVEASSDDGVRKPMLSHLAHFKDLPIGEFGAGMHLSLRDAAASGILPTAILCDAHPFEIGWQVVCAIEVEMVNTGAGEPAIDECPSDKHVHKLFLASSVPLSLDLKVAICDTWAKHLPLL